jgi:hypothetical protein
MTYAATPLRLDEHRHALARLWAEMSDERIASVIPDRMRWLYEEAPDGPTITVLGIHQESGEVVGCGSFFHRPTWVDGRRVRAGVLCEFAVTRAHRIGGAAIAIQRALAEAGRAGGLELLYGYPNAKSIAVFKRIGYQVVGETSTWVKPLRAAYKLRERLRWRWAAAAAAMPVDVALCALDQPRAVRGRLRFRHEVVPAPDRRVDALWEQARARYGVVGEKTASYLDWRYRRFTTRDHHIFGIFPRGQDRLEAYAIYTVEDGKAFLRDLFAEHLDASAEALLMALADHLRWQGVDSMSLCYLGSPSFGERLQKLGFLLRPAKRSLILHPEGVAEPLRARVFDLESWFMLDGELDI